MSEQILGSATPPPPPPQEVSPHNSRVEQEDPPGAIPLGDGRYHRSIIHSDIPLDGGDTTVHPFTR